MYYNAIINHYINELYAHLKHFYLINYLTIITYFLVHH